ncbi:short-chain dehydrogenase [Endozoicomonas sp. OPT23]|uniref:SDR family NAD(P)-dependent oxidoreductase n=1 Tax=Endozoicomonas sp. OPT23 TaxID=2072845 RepID=UPI00129B0434|nr:SDR family NAD(P)-dependent oxidoreductase [Endozoicomonas sp. OPT23]MRI32945.1 short-chain dehydrogenase [Endozoicomonas sp. OPT23]
MILITGASSGLGAALAQQYAEAGQDVVITGRNQQRLEAVKATNNKTQAIPADLTSPDSINSLINQLDIAPTTVIHCAGSGYFGQIQDQQPDDIIQLFNNNILSATLLLRELVARYRDQAVSVVVVMSTAALQPKGGESTYCAAKWAVRALVESVRQELKASKSPMKLIAVYPGGMATDFWNIEKDRDTTTFMSADEAAGMLIQALAGTEHGYISDITISRK